MEVKDIARKGLRLPLGPALWNLRIGIYAVFFPQHMQQVISFAPRPEPLFIRGVGVYRLLAAMCLEQDSAALRLTQGSQGRCEMIS